MSKFIINEQNSILYKHDYITKTFIKFINDNDFNNNLSWIEYNDFKKILLYI